ncbi:hypothetical protein bpmyx0001_10820 [Bacillus pseudomycoides DSM 12442]|nr:hypothetical protein bpmyx0001_10820 [Bacillus pseudomycoides DSM 12442]
MALETTLINRSLYDFLLQFADECFLAKKQISTYLSVRQGLFQIENHKVFQVYQKTVPELLGFLLAAY